MTATTATTATTALRSRRVQVSLLTGLLLALVTVFMPGAASADDSPASATGVPPGKAWVRVGHFVPGMGAATIELDPISAPGKAITLAGSATYGEVSAYEKLAPGTYTATVRDTDAAAGAAPVLSRSFEVAANNARTIAVVGVATAPRLALLTDDLTPPKAGTARVRLLSAADGAGLVSVRALGGPTIAEDAVLGQATDYATVPAGSWTLQASGAMDDATLQDVPVASGSVYTVVVLDDGSDAVKLDVVTDAAGAVVAPKGGAHTGLGGTAASVGGATDQQAGAWGLAAVVALLAGLSVGVLRRRRPDPARIG